MSLAQPVPVPNLTAQTALDDLPNGQPRSVIGATIDFSAPQAYLFDMGQIQASGQAIAPRSMLVNNTPNPSQVIVAISGTNIQFPIPPFQVVCIPIAVQQQAKITLSSVGGLYGANPTNMVFVEFYNYIVPPFNFAGFAPFFAGGDVSVFGNDGITPMSPTNPFSATPMVVNPISTFVTLNPAAGSTILVTAATLGAGKLVRFRNVGDAAGAQWPVFYNVNAAAVAAAGSSNMLASDGKWETFPTKVTQQINIITPTAANGGGAAIIELQLF